MENSFKRLVEKFKTYYYYLVNNNSRKYFFILISRKILNLFKVTRDTKKKNEIVQNWCNKNKISEKKFYLKIGLKKVGNFFEEKKSYYNSARLKEKKLDYKMGGMAHLNLIYNLIKHYKSQKILETGVAFGWSTLVFILAKKNHSTLTSVDLSYPTKSSYKFVGRALPSNFKKKFILLRGIDYYFLKFFNNQKKYFDFIHYDSDKSYLGRKKNYELIWKILKKKGCFVSDDISDNPAFYEFVKFNKLNYYILSSNSKFIGVVFK